MSNINSVLKNIFKEKRIVLWYGGEAHEDMQARFEEIELAGVEKIKVNNNEFALKYRLYKQSPKQQFLLFIAGQQVADQNNWLLDIGLGEHIFSSDEASIFLQELGLEVAFKTLVRRHIGFFRKKERLMTLQKLLQVSEETEKSIVWKMLAIIGQTEANLEAILMNLIGEAAQEEDKYYSEMQAYHLTDFLWKEVAKQFAYETEQPSVMNFVAAIFQSVSSVLQVREKALLNREATVLLHRWQDSSRYRESFEYFSALFAKKWEVETWLRPLLIEELLESDVFEWIDRKILLDVQQRILQETIGATNVLALIKKRSRSYWYGRYESLYQAFGAAMCFFDLLRTLDFRFHSTAEALQRYEAHYYKIDKTYRQYISAYRRTNHDSLLSVLSTKIEKAYSNQYLLPLNDKWQQQLDKAKKPLFELTQRQFWKQSIRPYVKQDKRIFVIISDALRYESGVELCERLLTKKRFEASISAMTAAVPSFTQLGMAALLPHRTLELTDAATVLADGKSTQGTQARHKILNEATGGKAVAITAADFFTKTSPSHQGRAWIKPFQVVYIYSNTIDKAGEDDEEKLFQRTEEEFEHIVKILKKIANINGTNVFITADHGYLYQYEALATSDFANFKVGGHTLKMNRRFVVGRNLEVPSGAMHFSSSDLQLTGDLEVAVPRSIHRLRQKGSGSRYVHGGMSLQELVIPLIAFSKKRTNSDNTKEVEIDWIKTISRITSYQLVLSFYQKQAVGAKRLGRTLRIGFYNKKSELISDVKTIPFESKSTEDRLRETKVRFIFSQAAHTDYQQEVYLRLEDTAGIRYREYPFILMLSNMDIDDFDL